MVGTVIDNSANSNLNNLTGAGKAVINNSVMPVAENNKPTFVSWVMPSTNYENKSYTKESNYTAPANGYFYLRATGGGSGAWISISLGNVASSADYITYKSDGGNTMTVIAPVAKNQVVTPSNGGNSVSTWRFYYAKGG